MSSYKYRIEIYEDNLGNWSYGCPDMNLMGYHDLVELLFDLKEVKA